MQGSERRVDHVTVAGGDLDAMCEAFESCGFETAYGGAHDNGVTHMAVVGFGDRSYVELIAKRSPGESPWWDREMEAEAGPCAWAIPAADVHEEARRLTEEGFAVNGPTSYARERPDGEVARWELAGVGGAEGDGLGAPLPMLVADETPLSRRVEVTSPTKETGVGGIERVVVVAEEELGLAGRFERFFGERAGEAHADEAFGARITSFERAPVAVAEPLDEGSWLADRLSRFGLVPCAYLFGASDPALTRERLSVRESGEWDGGRVDWLDLPLPGRYGVLDPDRRA